jgi:peptidoglycan biosynthesis protein MviN/MurJ (putative lipid II flippase)
MWIYLPIAASALVAVGIALAVLGSISGSGPAGWEHWAQLATIILAAGLLAAGFASWLILLTSIWGLGDLLKILPDFTSRMRLRFVTGARSWRRGFHAFKRSAAAISRFFSAPPRTGGGWEGRVQRSRRIGGRDEQ